MRDAGRCVAVVLVVVLCSALAAADAPVTVSPGHADRLAQVEGRCPTFSWGEVEGASSYDLVIYRLAAEEDAAQTVLRESFPGSVESWTPALEQCLERGGRYAWSVRAVGREEPSEWSAPGLFQVAAGPSVGELRAALEVVQRFTETQRGVEALRHDLGTGRDPEPPIVDPEAATGAGTEGAGGALANQIPAMRTEAGDRSGPGVESRGPLPFSERGISAEIEDPVSIADAQVVVRGAYSRAPLGQVRGYLGVQAGDIAGGDFDGLPELRTLQGDWSQNYLPHTVGVLGFGAPSGYGVVGVSRNSFGGWFFQADEVGNPRNHVYLSSAFYALQVFGPVDIGGTVGIRGSLTVSGCPSGTHKVGAWCIGPEETARNYTEARANCFQQGKMLCPLDAILACDPGPEPAGADCKTATDAPATKWIWCAELEDVSNDDINAFSAAGQARVFAGNGETGVQNEIDWRTKGNNFVSYCCTARP